MTDIVVRGDSQHMGTPRVAVGPITHRAPSEYIPPNVMGEDAPPEMRAFKGSHALQQFESSLPSANSELAGLRPLLTSLASGRPMGMDIDVGKMRTELAKSADVANAYAEEWRAHPRWYQSTAPGEGGGRRNGIDPREIAKGGGPLAKAVLDIGTQTNFSSIVGGQALGYVSLDTRVARGTVRPDSFTFYQSLAKSAAYQVVDYWPYIDDTGGALPGSATSGFSNVTSGTLATNAGTYSLQSVNLKLMLDGRAVTLALMAQNNFVSINEQENANAALTVIGTANWLCYFGNPTLYPNQFAGINSSTPTSNVFDFSAFYVTNASLQGWSTAQTLYNMIYECAAVITSWGRFGRITHAMMTPVTAGALQSLVTTLLNQIVASPNGDMRGVVVDGDLQGMRTRMGPIQFPMDSTITARDIPAQGQPRANGTTPTTTVAPTPPQSVTVAASGAAFGPSNWGVFTGTPYTVAATRYYYAVASTDVNMNESNLTWSGVIAGSGITSSGAAVVTITGPAAADATTYRVFRTGSGGATSTPFASGANSPTAVRYIGSVAANGASAVTFVDYNGVIPGSEKIFLLDFRAEDNALDYRYLLPLTRVELFAQNLYMPWAVCAIGALRNRIPKFHGVITNFVPDSPVWSPLGENF